MRKINGKKNIPGTSGTEKGAGTVPLYRPPNKVNLNECK